LIPYKDLNPSERFPFVTVLLIAANVAVFLYEVFLPAPMSERFVYRFAVIPLEFKIGGNISLSPGLPPIVSVFTAMFLHGGWFHVIGNMLYLWIFGDNVEDRMGPVRFLLFYLLCGIAATFAQIYGSFASKIPVLGASGAIAGVLAAYLRLFPKARIAVLVPIFYFFRVVVLPAWLILGLWVLLQVAEVQVNPAKEAGGIAYFAHIGGFVAGLLFMPLFVRKRRLR
jgi:membrane associated rhomboid family serine protease